MLEKKVLIKKQKIKNNFLKSKDFQQFPLKSKKNQFLLNNSLGLNGSYLFSNKGLLFNEPQLLKQEDSFLLNLQAFYRTSSLLNFRAKLVAKSSLNYRSSKISNFFKNTKFLKNNKILVNLVCLNRFIDKTAIKTDYAFYRPYKNILFQRNYNLWLDFIKVTNLIVNKFLDVKSFLFLLSSLFKYLNKRKHSKFIFFISNLFDFLITTYPDKIKGLKLIITGRLLSKPRSSTVKIERGTLNLTSSNACVASNQMHVYTLYGAFGLKLYINYQQ